MSTTPERKTQAKAEISKALASKHHAFVIHYACEGFDDPTDRITAIAVRNMGSGITELFDIRSRLPAGCSPTAADLDRAERKMLDDFSAFLRRKQDHYWLHWNMRDAKYGFAAIERRHRALGGKPVSAPEHMRIDLAARMFDLYGDRYAAGPSRLETLARKNKLTMISLLNGADQADALRRGDLQAVDQSLLNRIDILFSIALKTNDGALKTDARWFDGIGGPSHIAKWAKDHPLIVGLGAVMPLLGLGTYVWKMFS